MSDLQAQLEEAGNIGKENAESRTQETIHPIATHLEIEGRTISQQHVTRKGR